jgi:hypothetical protein
MLAYHYEHTVICINKDQQLISLINGLHTQERGSRCTHLLLDNSSNGKYAMIIPASPAIGILHVTRDSSHFLSGHVRMRGRDNGRYPFKYLKMLENIFCYEKNTIEVCSNGVTAAATKDDYGCCFTVDINPATNPTMVCNAETLEGIADNTFSRWRADPPYNLQTAKSMYGNGSVPSTIKLLKTGARVCKPGSLLFLLLGPKNYQICPKGVRRIGLVLITVVPNNEVWVKILKENLFIIFLNILLLPIMMMLTF